MNRPKVWWESESLFGCSFVSQQLFVITISAERFCVCTVMKFKILNRLIFEWIFSWLLLYKLLCNAIPEYFIQKICDFSEKNAENISLTTIFMIFNSITLLASFIWVSIKLEYSYGIFQTNRIHFATKKISPTNTMQIYPKCNLHKYRFIHHST